MYKKIFIILAFLPIVGFAQKYELTGKVIDGSMDFPLEYASVSAKSIEDGSIVNGGVTNQKGVFSIQLEEGTYDLEIEYISFGVKEIKNFKINKNTDLGTIKLGTKADSLDEVTVVAETTQVEVRLDKKIYNVGKDLTTAGGTVSDALGNVPSVTVDIDGGISLRGNSNVRILINGKPSSVAGFGSQDVFQQLPAEAIESVEVITSPSARYDAEGTGGIINIILKREKTLGFNGSVRGTVGSPRNTGIYTDVNLRSDDFNIFNSLGFSDRRRPGNAIFDNRYPNGQNFDRILETREYDRSGENFNLNTGVEYFIDDMSSVTGSFFMRLGDDQDITTNDNRRFASGTEQSTTRRIEDEREDDKRLQYSFNYEKRFDKENRDHKLTADLQYSSSDETKNSFIEENQIIPSSAAVAYQEVLETEDESSYLIQADYVKPIGDAQFEAGFRGDYSDQTQGFLVSRRNLNTGNLEIDENVSSDFDFKQNVTAVYTQYGDKFGDFSFLLGLRYENTQLKGNTTPRVPENFDRSFDFDKNFDGLFPTVNLVYELGEEENVTLGYNRRINRPRSWYLNPFPSQSSRTNVFQGNPDLNPSFANAFDLGYLKRWEKFTLTSSVYFQKETDAFERVQRDTGRDTEEDNIDIIENIPINLSTEQRYGAELGILYNPADWLRTNLSFNYFKFETDGSFEGIDYGASNESYFGRFSSNVILPWKIQWQTNAFYRGPRQNAQTETDPIASLDLAFSKDILNENATISLNVRDVFNSRRRDQFTVTDNFTSNSSFQWRERQITATLVYRFNQQKRDQNRRGGDSDDDGEYGG
ncbi:TonB-dependent receptor family protein [Psychroflexus sp. CAK57W]|uniref:outer membrane beta-barrel family protein n=1 Tax=Psychroflexus curvus TaxID=2873595 RepID=UPI001CCB3C6D|nr:outer membrane beta-barrel family protein [Psychroflexus curvus]MBZ9627567.1 TonB-dependent receptor family protein [Psychroflexus curvus]MBZ9786054.1 TonB-dependent receptor family protein [Psychroflexus curvus]